MDHYDDYGLIIERIRVKENPSSDDLKDLDQAIRGLMSQITPMFNNNGCPHKWRTYSGFTQTFEYCEICDQRRTIQ